MAITFFKPFKLAIVNLFIAQLNQTTTSQDLQKLFAHYGYVTSSKIIYDRFTGRSKGYGFVEMPKSAEAMEAITELNGTSFQDSIILVKDSQPTHLWDHDKFNQSNTAQNLNGYRHHEFVQNRSGDLNQLMD